MEFLLSADGAEALGDRFSSIEGITPILFQRDGTLTRDGVTVTRAEVSPKGAWLSLDVLITKRVFDYVDHLLNLPSLEWVQSTAAGFDNPLFVEMAKKGIRLTNSDAQAVAISEFVLGAVLSEFQNPTARLQRQAEKKWKGVGFREIAGTTWMIVGIGNIGNETAKRARAFDAHVIGVKRTGDSPQAHETIRPSDMKARLADCDVVVFASPLNNETHHMGNTDFFAAMKEGTTFVNIGRGGLVNESELLSALDKGTPGVAILDVFETEPLPETSALWDHPNVRVTPHSSPMSNGTPLRAQDLFIENLTAFVKDAPLRNEVLAATIIGSAA
jgi:phosphoglycerate dehydrogenase-like enzyme